jgi:hypothetical protein
MCPVSYRHISLLQSENPAFGDTINMQPLRDCIPTLGRYEATGTLESNKQIEFARLKELARFV